MNSRPFFAAPHRVHRRLPVALWFVEPAGLLVHFDRPHRLDIGTADFIIDGFRALSQHFGPGVRFNNLYSWGHLTGYTPRARNRLVGFALEARNSIERVTVELSPQSPAWVRMGVRVARAALVPAGLKMEVIYEPELQVMLKRRRVIPVELPGLAFSEFRVAL